MPKKFAAGEFAVFGQILLNKGSYGSLKFFSPKTFEKLMPKPLNQYYPNINIEWGIGLTWMRESHPQAGQNGAQVAERLLARALVPQQLGQSLTGNRSILTGHVE